MQRCLLAGLISALAACKGSPTALGPASGPGYAAQRVATLDVSGFEPPFEQIPVAQDFIAEHRVAKLSIHQLEPGTAIARSSEITEYNADGAPLRRYTRTGSEPPVLVERITYTQGDLPPATPGAPDFTQKEVVLDPARRITKVRTQRGSSSVIESYAYDAAGHLTRVAREVRGEGTVQQQEELRTYTGGRLTQRTRGEVSAAPFETLVFSHDAAGRFSEWQGRKPGFGADHYFFTYDPSGQLSSMRFQEGEKPIYERLYTYDADGFLTRIEMKARVPAMSSAMFVLAYELANGQARRPTDLVLPTPPKQKTDADVIASLQRVFPEAAQASVEWGDSDGRPFLETITFQVPAAQLDPATDEQLKEKACALRQALGFDECDCEYLQRGSTRAGVTIVTFHVMLGC